MLFVGKLFDVLLPPLCLACDMRVATHGTVCQNCWSQIHFIAAPYCFGCGAPFDAPVGEGQICAPCLTYSPVFSAARAAMIYDDVSKRLILGFKHGDRTHMASAMAQWMQRAGQEYWNDADVLVPVPLHRWRLFKRRYNQAAMLAQHVGQGTGKPVWVDGLLRQRPTPTQGHMSREERQKNVKGAFTVNPRYRQAMSGKNVILVDDVLTTGATLNECSRVLLEVNANSVRVLTLARVRGYV